MGILLIETVMVIICMLTIHYFPKYKSVYAVN